MATDILQTQEDQDSALYEVKLDVFEGPMDLLLYLIRKDELDIYDIPIARITNNYLGFLRQIHLLDIEQASRFHLNGRYAYAHQVADDVATRRGRGWCG